MFEIGLQFHLPTFKELALRDIVALGRTAHAGGISQVWMTDNLRSRNPYVVLTALAASVPVKLGTAVTVLYFRSPVDIADSVAAITELMDGREFSLGLARGNRYTPTLVETPKPLTMLREMAQSLRHLLSGETVRFSQYAAVAEYFNLKTDAAFALAFKPRSPVLLYCGGNGPKALAIGGASMDGVIFGGSFQAIERAGRVGPLMDAADSAARAAGRPPLRKVAEVKLSVSRDGRKAREFVRHSVARRLVALREEGYSDEDFTKMEVDAGALERLRESERRLGDFDLGLVTDSMIDALFIAGNPAECGEKMKRVGASAKRHGFQQLMFSELGPDFREGLELLCDEILPTL